MNVVRIPVNRQNVLMFVEVERLERMTGGVKDFLVGGGFVLRPRKDEVVSGILDASVASGHGVHLGDCRG